MKDYKKSYKMYCEAKKDIDEEPLDYEDWFQLEKSAEKEWESQEKQEKVFMCVWGVGYHDCDKVAKVEHHKEDFFTFDVGYEDEDIEQIKELDIGRSVELLTSGNHTVVRMQ